MKDSKFTRIVDHLWKHRKDYLATSFAGDFDYPYYGGLPYRDRSFSPEFCDAVQNIWEEFLNGDYTTKRQFYVALKRSLSYLGEEVTGDLRLIRLNKENNTLKKQIKTLQKKINEI